MKLKRAAILAALCLALPAAVGCAERSYQDPQPNTEQTPNLQQEPDEDPAPDDQARPTTDQHGACLQASPPRRVEMGHVPVGNTRTQELNVRNCSDSAPLTIHEVTLSRDSSPSLRLVGLPQALQRGSVTLAPGASLDFVVELAPQEPGDHRGTLVVRSDATPGRRTQPIHGSAQDTLDDLPTTDDDDIYYEITWGDSQADMDVHLLHPNGTWGSSPWDVHYANHAPDWGAPGSEGDPLMALDDTDGDGPEVVVLNHPEEVAYRGGVHFFNANGQSGPVEVTARLWVSGRVVLEAQRTLHEGEFWSVFELRWGLAPELELLDQRHQGYP